MALWSPSDSEKTGTEHPISTCRPGLSVQASRRWFNLCVCHIRCHAIYKQH